ncbi:unnamed protein product [Pocillopora meandrina]|uniref:BHLH domain-containing protein n=1 Tax=Pocillopora meandrina TaxID=46732 RepID=A0AAU9W3F7_9CNID|nr:unnamed protein product [Pocillopora meandrina]
MPRSFLVKRRKSADAKSTLDSDVTEKTQDPSNSSEEKKKFVPSCQTTQFHPQHFPYNTLGRKHHWDHTNAACLLNRPGTFPETPEAWVKCASECVNTHCCGYFHGKLGEPSSCLCCLTSQKFLTNVTQLQVPLWHRNMNYDSGCNGIFSHQFGPFSSKPLSCPVERLDVHVIEENDKVDDNLTSVHVGNCSTMFGVRLENNPKFVKTEEVEVFPNAALKEDKDEIRKELPTKKIKLTPVESNDMLTKEDSKKSLNHEHKTGVDSTTEKTKLDDSTPREKIKQESPEPETIVCGDVLLSHRKTNKYEEFEQTCQEKDGLNNHKKHKKQSAEVKRKASNHEAKKIPQTKSKKGSRDSNTKPYNTRVVTSRRPRTYSNDFVLAEEEEDWKQGKEDYQMKGRQRTKLNRLLANEHERRRVAQLNSAYQDLRQLIPGYQCDTKLPKIKILKYAINYIAHLDDILADDFTRS